MYARYEGENVYMHSAKLQVAKPAWLLPHFVALLLIPRPPPSPSSLPHLIPVVVLRFYVAVSHKVSPSANRTTNNHKVAALCRNRIPSARAPRSRMPAGIKVVGPLIVPKDITL